MSQFERGFVVEWQLLEQGVIGRLGCSGGRFGLFLRPACDAMAMALARKKVEPSFHSLPADAERSCLLNVFANIVIASSF